ncbi:MAG: hypothetical protein ABIF18_03220, partial [archaeon]
LEGGHHLLSLPDLLLQEVALLHLEEDHPHQGHRAGHEHRDIVLLDEPTSSVDGLNEMKIHDSIFKEFKNKTIVSSIHRLHLLNKFDYIYMFEKGKIIAEGNLDEIKKNSRFRHIWKKYGTRK